MDDMGPVLSGIRYIDPKAAELVRARINRDSTYYRKLQNRLHNGYGETTQLTRRSATLATSLGR